MQVLQQGIDGTGAPYSYGFAIILLTVIVKAATFPLTQKQVRLPWADALQSSRTLIVEGSQELRSAI